MAARVRTLPAAIAPVLVGTSLALGDGHFHPLAFVAALLGAVFIQVGTNLSNDYSDARRGADTEDRLGPVRVTAGGLVPPEPGADRDLRDVRRWRCCAAPTWSRSPAGSCWRSARRRSSPACSTPAGRARTATRGSASCSCSCSSGSSRSTGSYFVQVQELPWQAFVCAVPVGLLASAILVVNNVRDIDTDRRAGKRTLAVRLGRERTRALYTAMVAVAFLDRAAAVGARLDDRLAAAAAGRRSRWRSALVRVVRTRTDGPALNGALARTGALQLVFCLLFSAGILAERRASAREARASSERTLRLAQHRCEPPTATVERARAAARDADRRGRRQRLRRGGAAGALRRRQHRARASGAGAPTAPVLAHAPRAA